MLDQRMKTTTSKDELISATNFRVPNYYANFTKFVSQLIPQSNFDWTDYKQITTPLFKLFMTFSDKTSSPAEKKEIPIHQAIGISFITKIIEQFQYKLGNQDKDKCNHRDQCTEHDRKSQHNVCIESALCNRLSSQR